ncbi:hypothetical protein FSP39_009393 [Pinctada imbricata]|uniref:Large ribosomal subunit protein eL36 n=1 Tax=Pinctada imbricata TaxID=66713 RepID=A0AA89BWW5_PINIB|nr:hypothetical protein FSP39_009393 [Pinctada imbricata]
MGIKYNMAVGLNKGHKVTPVEGGRKTRPSRRKGACTKHARFVRDLVREVTGFAPYERRIQELLRISKDRRALKFAKKRVCVDFDKIKKFIFCLYILIMNFEV